MKKFVFVSLIFLLVSACGGSKIKINDLETSNGVTYFEGEPFTGTAEKLNANDQLKQTQEFENGKLLTKVVFVDDKPFYEENYSLNNDIQITSYPVICSRECIVESNDFEDIVFKGIHLENVVFKNSNFKNVVIEGKGEDFSILDNVKFQDSNIDLTIQGKVATMPWIVDARSWGEFEKYEELTDKSYEKVSEIFSVSLNNVSGSITTDNVESFFGLSIEDSSLESISLNDDLKSKDSKDLRISPFLMVSNTDVDNLYFQDLFDRENLTPLKNMNQVVFSNSNVKNLQVLHISRGISCDNSTFEDGYLPRIIGYCEDMGETFDDYAFEDSMEAFNPDFRLYNLKYFASPRNKKLEEQYYDSGLKYFHPNDALHNRENLQKGISEGDTKFLYTYLTEIYYYYMTSRNSFKEIQICPNDEWGGSLLYWYGRGTNYSCEDAKMIQGSRMDEWLDVDPKFRSSVEPEILEMAMQSMASERGGFNARLNRERNEKYPGKLYSLEKRKELAKSYVEKHHDFSELPNCLRGSGNKNAITLMSNLRYQEKVDEPTSVQDRLKLSEAIYLSEEAEKDEGVIKLRACIENNVSVVYRATFAAYQPFSDLAAVLGEEVKIARDSAALERKLAKEKRAAEIEALFKDDDFLDGLQSNISFGEAAMFTVYANKCSSVNWMGREDARILIKALNEMINRAISREELDPQKAKQAIRNIETMIAMGGFTSEQRQLCQMLTLTSREFIQKPLGL